METLEKALKSLMKATKKAEVEKAIKALEETHGGKWRPVGDAEGNASTIMMSGNPDASFIERVTNALDATIEAIVEKHPILADCRSPREFAEKAFGIQGGHLTAVERKKVDKLADKLRVAVTIQKGDAEDTPTVDIEDHGIGMLPEELPDTILSLHRRNKIRKWYLMGRFGQGGSTALRHSPYTTIISKKMSMDDAVNPIGFTICKWKEPEEGERDGMYVYLVGPTNEPFSIPGASVDFHEGTLVRHIDYEFLKKGIFLNFYGVLDRFLFDPIIPFSLVMNTGSQYDGLRHMTGARFRLEGNKKVEYANEVEVPLDETGALGTVVVRYWVLQAKEQGAVRTFVETREPISVTYLGQTHAAISKQVLNRECKLPYVYEHMVVQVDCDSISDLGRRKLFISSRESTTTEGRGLVEDAVVKALKGDEDLKNLDAERAERFITKGTNKQREAMRKRLAEMINRIKPGTFVIPSGGGGTKSKRKKKSGGVGVRPALPTSSFPTYLKIVNKPDPLAFTPGETHRVELNSDAPDGFLAQQGGNASILLSEDTLKHVKVTASSTDFRGGRFYLSLEVVDGVEPGTHFEFSTKLSCVKGAGTAVELVDSRAAMVEKPSSGPEGTPQNQGLAPNIIEVGPDVDDEAGINWWKERDWTDKHVAEVRDRGDEIDIYVSVANRYYIGAIKNSKYSAPRKRLLKTRYVLHIALHAYLQEEQMKKLDVDLNGNLEKIRNGELERAARTVLTAITSEEAFKEAGLAEDSARFSPTA